MDPEKGFGGWHILTAKCRNRSIDAAQGATSDRSGRDKSSINI